ncbi:ABC transporter ATP-binding protein, partial [Streptomyces cavourensis]
PGGDRLDILSLSPEQLRAFRWQELSLVFQGAMNSLNPVHTVHSQLTDVLKAHRPNLKKSQRTDRAKELLSLVGISADRLAAYPHQLSGGMRQRVMIAMALALEPEIVIMDEPTTALDVTVQAQILDLLHDLRQETGMGLLLVTHDVGVAAESVDEVLVMRGGREVERGPVARVLGAPREAYTKELLAAVPR